MSDPKDFIDNLANLGLVMSVAFEHVQNNRDEFVNSATVNQVRQFEQLISQIRTLAEQLEREFSNLEYLVGHTRP